MAGAAGEVEGLVLEAVAMLDAQDPIPGYLFFLTDDVPFEDALSITLTDPALRILDTARLGGAYATGAWRDPAIDGPGRLSFRFIDEKRWRLRVLPRPGPRLPFLSEPRGVHRPLGLTRHFVLAAGPEGG
ncbi:hypothetical protein J2X36_000356 [Methylobacterium sp. BE186]|uniref:hypothetical protein n=1 Tax=Methylobacterium sp. BE186 TaxID=2817715 RepID=UPI0028564EDF|nr:hypothetical protein [Methylobacterium sp. BE186]MDR7035621.1 hypothetical protein [Methylobacterium sp. BE186]